MQTVPYLSKITTRRFSDGFLRSPGFGVVILLSRGRGEDAEKEDTARRQQQGDSGAKCTFPKFSN